MHWLRASLGTAIVLDRTRSPRFGDRSAALLQLTVSPESAQAGQRRSTPIGR
jgi:hypothetical protein